MKIPINVDDILFKVLQQQEENNIEQFVSDAIQQQLGIDKVCYEMKEHDLEGAFDSWLEENFQI